MTGRGPWQRALDLRADTPDADRIDHTAREWERAGRALTSAAFALERHAADADLIGGRSGPAIRAALLATAERMTQRAESLHRGATALDRAHRAVVAARQGRNGDEDAARQLVERIDAEFRQAAAVMAEIRGSTRPDAVPADPERTSTGPADPRPTPEPVGTPTPELRPIEVRPQPELTFGLDTYPGPHRSTPDRHEVVAAAPAVLGAATPAVEQPIHVGVTVADVGAVAGVTVGGLLGVGGLAVLRHGGLAMPPGVRPIGSDSRAGIGGALAPGSPVTAAGRRTPPAVVPATTRRAGRKRPAKRIRLRTRRIGRRRIKEDTMGDRA